MPPVIAIDAMGGDRAPAEIVAGALRRPPSSTSTSCSSAGPTRSPRTCPAACSPSGVEVLAASEVIAMDDEPASAGADEEGLVDRARRGGRARRPRRTRWSAPATPARRWPPRCCASAGSRACTARRSRCRSRCSARTALQLLVDGGATVDPQPEWLVEWAMLGREYARVRLGVAEPTVGLLSNGEEPGKGDALRKARVGRCSPR